MNTSISTQENKMYHLRTQDFQGTSIISAHANNGGAYIGDKEWADTLVKRGIEPELRTPESSVCSIGFCEKEQKWYGWSHRAMYGFGIGSKVVKGDCGYQPANKDDFLADCLSFWGDNAYHTDPKVEEYFSPDGAYGALVTAAYNDTFPNEALRSTKYSNFTPYPEKWGRGEWEAQTLEDAKQMAMDFAEDVS